MDSAARSSQAQVGNFCRVCGRPVSPGVVCAHGATSHAASAPPPLPAESTVIRKPRRTIMQILLDPRTIQWLLATGGGLLVTGLVIWLASLGIFDNPMIVAAAMGMGTLVVLSAGWWTIRRTRFELAGRAVTLLACLVMPLNLWFYHAHNLLTLQDNLWVAAVVCCALYAASALIVRDPLFVYVLCAGVAGTGMLILTDMHKFAEIAAPCLTLVVMGLSAIHCERAFPKLDSPFSRDRFGKAFFFSGHALLGAGLALLLGAQITGWLIAPLFTSWNITAPEIITNPNLRLLAIAIVLAGTYAYVYSDVVVRKIGLYVYPAAFTLLWAELLGLQMLRHRFGPEVVLVTLSFTALLLNVTRSIFKQENRGTRTMTPLALFLSIVPVIWGLILHVRATNEIAHNIWAYTITPGYVFAMAMAVISCRVGAFLYRKTDSRTASTYFFLTGAATLVGAAGLLNQFGITNWANQAPILMLIPIVYAIASRIYREPVDRDSLLSVAHVATIVMVISVLGSATHLTPQVVPVQGTNLNLTLAAFFFEGAAFYALLSGIRQQSRHVFCATAMAGGALWQLLGYAQATAEVHIIAFAVVGLTLLIAARLMHGLPSRSILSAGHALMTLSFLSSALMVMSRMLASEAHWSNALLLGAMMLLTLIASMISGPTSWRRLYLLMTVANGMLAFILLNVLSTLSGWQKAELFSVVAGLVLLVVGHIGWYREQDSHNDFVSFLMTNGALLAGVPLLIASIWHRFGATISMPDEIALLTIAILMLVSGVVCQLRSTTIAGGGLLALHIAMLLAFAGWKAQLALGVYLSVGGAVVFLAGLGLAIYRDRLMLLPEKIHNREGVFKVLAWR